MKLSNILIATAVSTGLFFAVNSFAGDHAKSKHNAMKKNHMMKNHNSSKSAETASAATASGKRMNDAGRGDRSDVGGR